MSAYRRYKRKGNEVVIAIQLDLDTEGFSYQKQGAERRCNAQDWLLSDRSGTYAVDDSTFARAFEEIGVGQYTMVGIVRAKVSDSAGHIRVGQRKVPHEPGDYLVWDESTQSIGYAVPKDWFEASYVLAPEGDTSAERGQTKRYRAFISYSRTDGRIAKRIHRALEKYRIPRDLASGDTRRLGRFFKDDDELAGSEELGAALDGAINDSENLIVIASPEAARSEWVKMEGLRFKRRKDAKAFAVIVRGTPNSGDPDTECFPPALRYQVDSRGELTEDRADPPLAPDLTSERFSRVFVRLVAGLLAIPFDTLWRREKRRLRRRRAIRALSASTILCTVLLAMAAAMNGNDKVNLRSRSVEISREMWRVFEEGKRFDPAFRAALAASALENSKVTGEVWDLGTQSESITYAVALCGRTLQFRRIFGDYPNTSRRPNFRDDIPTADPARRVALRVEPSVRDLCFSGDSRRVGMSTSDGRFLVFDVPTGKTCFTQRFDDVGMSSRIALNDPGTEALVSGRKHIYFLDIDKAEVTPCETPEYWRFHEMAFFGGKWLGTMNRKDGTTVCQIAPDSCRVTRSIAIPDFTPYKSNAFTRTTTRFVGYNSSEGLTVAALDTESQETIRFEELGHAVGQVKSIAVNSDGQLVALGGNGSGSRFGAEIQVVSVASRSEKSRLTGHTGEVYCLDFMPGTGLIASGGSDIWIRIWDAASGRELIRLSGHLGVIQALKFSPNGALLATASGDGTVLLWDTSRLHGLERESLSQLVAASPQDGWEAPSMVVTAEERREIVAFQGRPWNIRDWRTPWSFGGMIQSVRALSVRWFGWSTFDYQR